MTVTITPRKNPEINIKQRKETSHQLCGEYADQCTEIPPILAMNAVLLLPPPNSPFLHVSFVAI